MPKKIKSCRSMNCCGEKDKKIKIYFCPKCRSKDVGYILGIRNIFGLIPRMRCRKCRFEAMSFPQIVISEKELNKLERKNVKRR